MKNILTILFLLVIAMNSTAQYDTWINYTSLEFPTSSIIVDNHIWVGGIGSGLVKININTGHVSLFNKANSGIQGNVVSALASDSHGNIWVGSLLFYQSYFTGGLSKYDGSNWEVFTTDNFGLPSNDIQSLAFDAEGSMWVGTLQDGLGVFDGISWEYYNPSNSIVPERVDDIEIANNGEVWIASRGEGIYKFDGTSWVNFNDANSGLNDDDVNDIDIDANGNLWIGVSHFSGGLVFFDGIDTWEVYNTSNSGISKNSAQSVCCYEDAVWLTTNATGGGVCCFKNSEWEVFIPENSGISSSYAYMITVDDNGVVWIGTNGSGLDSYDGTTWYSHLYTTGKMPNNSINCISMGDDGKIWISAGNDGLVIKDNSTWEYIHKGNSNLLHSHSIESVAADVAGTAWVACYNIDGGVLFYYDGTEMIDYTSTNPAFDGEYFNTVAVNDGKVWVGTDYAGIHVYDGQNWIVYKENEDYIAIDFDQQGNVWMLGSEGLSVLYSNNTWESWDSYNSNFPVGYLLSIEIDENDNKWIGLTTGLVKFDGIDFTHYDMTNSGLPNDNVRSVKSDEYGKLWLGTALGLASFDGTSWETYDNTNSGLSASYIMDIEIDEEGSKWIGTFLGAMAVYNENGVSDINEENRETENKLALKNYPNPFSRFTNIEFDLERQELVSIIIFDQFGRQVERIEKYFFQAGKQQYEWNATSFPCGVYFVQVRTGQGNATRKVLKMR